MGTKCVDKREESSREVFYCAIRPLATTSLSTFLVDTCTIFIREYTTFVPLPGCDSRITKLEQQISCSFELILPMKSLHRASPLKPSGQCVVGLKTC